MLIICRPILNFKFFIKTQAIAAVMFYILLLLNGFFEIFKELGKHCGGNGQCCQKSSKPTNKNDICTNPRRYLSGRNKTCKTFKQSIAISNDQM